MGRIEALVGLGEKEEAAQTFLKILRPEEILAGGQRLQQLQINAMMYLLESDPKNLKYLEFLGEAYRSARQYDKMRDTANKRLDYANNDNQRAAAYSERSFANALLYDDEAALADSDQAVRLSPTVYAYINRASRNKTLVNYLEAIKDTTSALSLTPASGPKRHKYLMKRAVLYVDINNNSKALEDYNKAIGLIDDKHKDSVRISF